MAQPFSRQRLEFAYSLALIILIPASIVASALWLTSQMQANFDLELRRKANLANEVFGVGVASTISANDRSRWAAQLQQQIDQTRRSAPEIDQLSVSVPGTSGAYLTIASSDPDTAGQPDDSIQTQLAWSKGQAVASLVAVGESQQRAWVVYTPVLGSTGQPVAVTRMRVTLQAADALIAATLRTSAIGLAVLLGIIVLLLLNHFRLVQYAELFRKQRELDRMKDDFISIATHELKAPMSVIKGYISMILEEKLPAEVEKMARIAFDQTDRLGRLVTDLLDVSRIEQGRTKYNLQTVDLAGIINPLLITYQAKAAEKQLGLSYKPPAQLPAVKADPDRCGEIFTNLIDNAIKYSRAGSVTVEHVVTPTGIVTKVSDTGIGLTPEEIGNLFQRFYRARNSDTQDIPGTGLGLWIIKQYAQAMGGNITVESTKGQGSTFTVTLPLAAPAGK